MIHFLVGENWYGRDEALRALLKKQGADVVVERPEVAQLSLADLQLLLGGHSLFGEARCVVLHNLSAQKELWETLETTLTQLDDQTTLVVLEDKPDKRTKTYKALKAQAEVEEFPLWTPRDTTYAVEWLVQTAKKRGVALTSQHARHVVNRAGVDQARLAGALEKLALLDEISPDAINATVEAQPNENVFALLETALEAHDDALRQMVAGLRQTEEPYRVAGLLSSQLLQLAAVVFNPRSTPAELASLVGAPPFVISKLVPHARRITPATMRELLEVAADTDMKLKSLPVDPWLLVEELLIKIAHTR